MALWHPALRGGEPLDRRRHLTAADVLGPSHPVARAAQARSVLLRQLAANGAFAILATAMCGVRHAAPGVAFASAAVVVQFLILAGVGIATVCVRERTRDLIADGVDDLSVAEVAAEAHRLRTHRHRTALAGSLARAQYAAIHWHELSIGSRPPPSVRNLAEHAAITTEIIALVRDPDAPVRGVALVDRLLRGGYGATLYVGSPDALARELGRIRYLLRETPPAIVDDE